MAKKAEKPDAVQEAFDEVTYVTGMPPETGVFEALLARQAAAGIGTTKNPAAVMLGRKGGLKGGPARMAAMSAAERSKFSADAAKKRWRKAKIAKKLGLTPEEMQILRLVNEGKSTADVAKSLGLSKSTLKAHRDRAMGKLKDATTAERDLLNR